jgi:DegV family protein with EDD domain
LTVAVVTDSAADLPPSLARSLGIRVVPLVVTFGDRSFRDGEELEPDDFWARLDAAAEPPMTAAPPPADFAAAYAEAAERGAEGIVSVHLAGELSRTVRSAETAAREAALPVEVVDARAVSMGEGLVALAAAWAARAGGRLAEVAAVARSCPPRTRMFAMADGVEYLRRGGRLGAAKATVSDLLRIRPILTVREGVPELAGTARTRSRAITDVLERAAAPAEAAAVIHSNAPEAAEVIERVREATGVAPVEARFGAVLGAHLGPAALGIVVLSLSEPSPAAGGPEGSE